MAAFTPGNIVVYRVGSGSTALTGSATQVFLDEYTPAGTLVQSIALPTAASGANHILTAAGTATSEGLLTLSADGHYLLLTGYDATVGSSAPNAATATADPRIVGRVDANGNIDTSTVLTGFSTANNIRSVASSDGSAIWAAGATGDAYTTFGSTSTPTTLGTVNTRQVEIFNGQLYYSTGSGTAGIYSLGSGLPTTGGQTGTLLAASSNPYSFYFADLSAAVPGVDTLYVVDATGANGLEKFSLVGGSWLLTSKVTAAVPLAGGNAVSVSGLTGLTASVSGTTVTLFESNPSSLFKLVDTSGYNAAFSATSMTTIATAGTNTAFRGIAFAPQAAVASTPNLTVTDVSHSEGDTGTVTYTFTVSLSAAAGVGGVTFDIATADGTATAASGDYVARSLTSQTIPQGSNSYTFDVTVNSDRAIEPNENFFVNVTNVTGATVTDGQGQGTIVNDDTTPALSIDDVSKVEGDNGTITYTFTVSLDHPARTGGVTFDIATADGTATTADGDYVGRTLTSQTIPEGQSTYTFDVTVNGDTKVESNETFAVNVTNVTGATVADGQGTGTIVENDIAPTLSINDVTKAEGQSGTTTYTFTVSLDHPAPAGGVTFDIATSDGSATAGSDYVAKTLTSQTIPAGSTSYTFDVVVNGDRAFEGNETFNVTVSNVTGATVGDGAAVGTITNDDTLGVPFVNEFHYDNSGTDSNEGIEIAGPAGTSLAGWTLVLYNGTNTPTAAPTYGTINLSGTIPNQDDGYGVLTFAVPGLQNGAKDGFALVDASGNVVQFLSYEGTITGAAGTPAAGITSTDVGVSEEPAVGVGLSLQLTGTGASYGDFTWQAASTSSFGSVNAGQDFIGTGATGLVSIADASIAEGDAGTSTLYLTVHRAGGLGQAASVDWTLTLDGTADSADIDPNQPMTGHIDFPAGVAEVKIAVAIVGDTTGEDNETFHVSLSNAVGNITITNPTATGTILNDDFVIKSIMEIQGASHISPLLGQHVQTTGIVTQVGPNGYYIQDPNGDGNDATSDAVYVFTHTAPTVNVGDAVQVNGTVAEFSADPGVGLTVTEIDSPTTTVLSTGNALPAAVIIGVDGRLPPPNIIDDDHLTSYDPATDGIDFFESLEGMRVTIENPQVIQSTNSFGETYVVASDGQQATGVAARGGLTLSGGDTNPERIQIDSLNSSPTHFTEGDRINSVTGILGYSHDEYEVLTSVEPTLRQAGSLARETTSLVGDAGHLAIATYNLENMDASDNKYTTLAHDIIDNLGGPDIIGVQEVQDDNGTGTGVLSAAQNLQNLVDALNALDPNAHYVFAEIDPTAENSTGGEPNGNIRNAFLYDTNRVTLVGGSLEQIQGEVFHNSRPPLVGTFTFNGQNVTVIDVHSYSRGGSQPDFGVNQPPVQSGDDRRTAMADAIRAYVDAHLATTPDQQFAVLGDFNGFYYETAISHLTAGGVLTNLNGLLPSEERYSYQFDGNLQEFDYILVTNGLTGGAQYDSVHLNAEFSAASRPTDHDPQVALFSIPVPNQAPTNLSLDHQAVDENQPSGTVVGTLSATDKAGDTLTYALTDDAGGRFTVNPQTGVISTTAAFDHEANASFSITATVTDQGNLSTQQTFVIAIGDVNEAPSGQNDAVAVDENADSGNLWTTLLGNDTDPETDTLTIVSVDTTGTLGHVVFDPQTQTLRYVADNPSFDALATGATAPDHLTYTLSDGHGHTSTATVNVTVTAIDDSHSQTGGDGNETLTGTTGEDTIDGGDGNDYIDLSAGGTDHGLGGAGNDAIYFGTGYSAGDSVDGGAGTDTVGLRGDYAGANAVTIANGSFSNVEVLSLMTSTGAPVGYDITWDNGNLADGQKMTIYAGNLASGENVVFDGSAETHGYFVMYGGLGDDDLTGGANSDGFYFGPGKFDQNDHVDGGGGTQNQLGLDGSYDFEASSALGTFGGNFTGIQTIVLYKGDAR
ncbi:MAG: cadherin domain-containing protein, partial [Alphaproteobacteria bacterium]|nr:cadherin domain-containing protein [Alphaproteobacteria bacterium]